MFGATLGCVMTAIHESLGVKRQMTDTEPKDDNQALHQLCLDWSQWHRSRRLFAPPIPQNILARMRPQPVREVPDAILSAELSYFNLALLSEPESAGKTAFYLFYLHQARPIKMIAAEMKISRPGFYKAMWAVRKDVHRRHRNMMSGMLSNRETNELEHFPD